MEVILREDIPGLGIIGEIVRVRPGYARNFLIPRGLALPADSRSIKRLEHQQRVIAAKKARERGAHEKLAAAMGSIIVETEARAGRGGKLFGSVTNMDVHRLLAEKGFELDRRRIELKEPIKAVGEFEVRVRVGQEIDTMIKVVVKPIGGELEDKSVDGEDEAPPAPVVDTEDGAYASAAKSHDEDGRSEGEDAGVDDGADESGDAEKKTSGEEQG